MKLTVAVIFLILPSALFPQIALGQSDIDRHPLLTEKFSASIGAYVFDKSIQLRVDGQSPGEEIDFDERLNLKSDEASISLNFRWRFGEKWSLWGQYFNSDDSARVTLKEDVHWEDIVFKEGTNVGAGVDLSVARIFFGRKFSAGPQHELVLGAGFHWLEIGAFIDGEIFFNDEALGFDRRSVSAEFPLPNVGGWYGYAISPRWLVNARVDWLSISIGDYSGGLWNVGAGVQYQAFENIGFNLNYQFFRLDGDVKKSNWRGAVELEYYGPFLAMTANW